MEESVIVCEACFELGGVIVLMKRVLGEEL